VCALIGVFESREDRRSLDDGEVGEAGGDEVGDRGEIGGAAGQSREGRAAAGEAGETWESWESRAATGQAREGRKSRGATAQAREGRESRGATGQTRKAREGRHHREASQLPLLDASSLSSSPETLLDLANDLARNLGTGFVRSLERQARSSQDLTDLLCLSKSKSISRSRSRFGEGAGDGAREVGEVGQLHLLLATSGCNTGFDALVDLGDDLARELGAGVGRGSKGLAQRSKDFPGLLRLRDGVS